MKTQSSNKQKAKFSGWGRAKFTTSNLCTFSDEKAVQNFLQETCNSQNIARGLGRSYGDASQLEDGNVLDLSFAKRIALKENEVDVGASVSIEELLDIILPKGYFIPVSPGSAKVTIGGAIASDVHGKNHHIDGSFGNYVSRILLLDANSIVREIKPIKENGERSDEFWATIGGMGLTGIILEATISLIKIDTSLIKVDTFVCDDLNSLMEKMLINDQKYKYSVAWLDSLHESYRGVLSCGNHVQEKEINDFKPSSHLYYSSKSLVKAPSFLPGGLLNKLTVKAFNETWFQKAKFAKNSDMQSISQFFHPLDGVDRWNRIYGNKGFYQYQFVVPDHESYFVFKVLKTFKKNSINSFLAVLKRFGKKNHGLLSFPTKGWTLAIDIPVAQKNILKILDSLDEELANIGGKLYLAKDLRQKPSTFKKTYPTYENWKAIKLKMDPQNIFQSDLSKRLEF